MVAKSTGGSPLAVGFEEARKSRQGLTGLTIQVKDFIRKLPGL